MQIYGWNVFLVCHHPDQSCDHNHCNRGGIFLICHVTSHEHMLKELRKFVWKPFLLSHCLAMFGGHWSTTNGDTKYLICHVSSIRQVSEGSSNLMNGSSSLYVTIFPNLVVTGIAVLNIQSF